LALRPGLKWSDGQPITADDFIFGTLLYLAKDMPVPGLDPYDSVARIARKPLQRLCQVRLTTVPETLVRAKRFEDHGNLSKDHRFCA